MKNKFKFLIKNLTLVSLFVTASFNSFSQNVEGELLDERTLELKVLDNNKKNLPGFDKIVSSYSINLSLNAINTPKEDMLAELKKVEGVINCSFNSNNQLFVVAQKKPGIKYIPLFEEVIEKREITISTFSESIYKVK